MHETVTAPLFVGMNVMHDIQEKDDSNHLQIGERQPGDLLACLLIA